MRYEDRYGFIFLICATGKSASEMLHALQARMEHAAEDEVNRMSMYRGWTGASLRSSCGPDAQSLVLRADIGCLVLRYW